MGLTAAERVGEVVLRSEHLLNRLRDMNFAPSGAKSLDVRYTVKDASKLVGRSRGSIHQAEVSGKLPPPERNASERHLGYTLDQINTMRDHFGTRNGRSPGDAPVRLTFQNFKGGVAKSTLCTHLAQYLAMQGYRVLLVDVDPQGSSTYTFGFLPDLHIEAEQTLLPWMQDEADSLEYAIQPTYWPGIDLIPSNLDLFQGEYELMAVAGERPSGYVFTRLRDGLSMIEENYDVIIMDPPPSLGLLSLNVMYAATSVVVPVAPSLSDFSSTISFMRMLYDNLGKIEKRIKPINYKFFRMLVTRYDDNRAAQKNAVRLMMEAMGGDLLRSRFLESAEVNSAMLWQKTVYELTAPSTTKAVYERCINSLNSVCGEIEQLIKQTWPSYEEELKASGIVADEVF